MAYFLCSLPISNCSDYPSEIFSELSVPVDYYIHSKSCRAGGFYFNPEGFLNVESFSNANKIFSVVDKDLMNRCVKGTSIIWPLFIDNLMTFVQKQCFL